MLTEERRDAVDRVAKLAAEIAHVASVDPDSALADVGFDSIAYAELALAVEEEFGVRLADTEPERLGTAAAVAGEVARLGRQAPAPRIPSGIGRIQRTARRTAGPVLAHWYRFEVRGLDHVPRSGPAIVAANHTSMLDVPFLALAVPRPLWFMSKIELFSHPVSARLFHALGGFPVRREIADLRAIDMGLAILGAGRLLGMYPEGTRSLDGRLQEFLPGVAWMALVSGAPIVPAGIVGTAESLPRGTSIPKRTRVRVAFGRPIEVERETDPDRRRARAAELTAELHTAIRSLIV